MQKVPYGKYGCGNPSQDCSNCSPHHAPSETENKDWVEDNINNCANQRGNHSKSRIPIRPDDRVHCLPEHIKRNPQRDIEEIFLQISKCARIDRTAKHCNNRVSKNKIDCGQNEAVCYRENYSVPHIALCFEHFFSAQTDAYECTASIAHKNCDCQSHYNQWECHCISSIAIGTKVVCVCNEDLLYRAPTSNEMMQGAEYFCISFPIRSVPKN